MPMNLDDFDWGKEASNQEVDVDLLVEDEFGFVHQNTPLDGVVVSFYGSGQIESRRPCLHGLPHGCCKWWHENGQLSEEWTSFAGMGHGWSTRWDDAGNVRERRLSAFGRALEWQVLDAHGVVTEFGSNREHEPTLQWIEKFTRRFPQAAVY